MENFEKFKQIETNCGEMSTFSNFDIIQQKHIDLDLIVDFSKEM